MKTRAMCARMPTKHVSLFIFVVVYSHRLPYHANIVVYPTYESINIISINTNITSTYYYPLLPTNVNKNFQSKSNELFISLVILVLIYAAPLRLRRTHSMRILNHTWTSTTTTCYWTLCLWLSHRFYCNFCWFVLVCHLCWFTQISWYHLCAFGLRCHTTHSLFVIDIIMIEYN